MREAFLLPNFYGAVGNGRGSYASPRGGLKKLRGGRMKDFQESTYGDRIAEVYDDLYGGLASPEVVDSTVDVLANLAGGGRALELGIGTGRIALPLAARGVEVHGIDASAAMVEKMRRKPGGDRIPVTLCGFADVEVDGRFSLIYVVFNTFFALLSQEAQVRCLENVARRLSDGGATRRQGGHTHQRRAVLRDAGVPPQDQGLVQEEPRRLADDQPRPQYELVLVLCRKRRRAWRRLMALPERPRHHRHGVPGRPLHRDAVAAHRALHSADRQPAAGNGQLGPHTGPAGDQAPCVRRAGRTLSGGGAARAVRRRIVLLQSR